MAAMIMSLRSALLASGDEWMSLDVCAELGAQMQPQQIAAIAVIAAAVDRRDEHLFFTNVELKAGNIS